MIKLRKMAAASALGLSMSLALLGTGVASAHLDPSVAIGINNSHCVKVVVVQHIANYGYVSGDYYGQGSSGGGFGQSSGGFGSGGFGQGYSGFGSGGYGHSYGCSFGYPHWGC